VLTYTSLWLEYVGVFTLARTHRAEICVFDTDIAVGKVVAYQTARVCALPTVPAVDASTSAPRLAVSALPLLNVLIRLSADQAFIRWAVRAMPLTTATVRINVQQILPYARGISELVDKPYIHPWRVVKVPSNHMVVRWVILNHIVNIRRIGYRTAIDIQLKLNGQ
jgi:hypothetical protein